MIYMPSRIYQINSPSKNGYCHTRILKIHMNRELIDVRNYFDRSDRFWESKIVLLPIWIWEPPKSFFLRYFISCFRTSIMVVVGGWTGESWVIFMQFPEVSISPLSGGSVLREPGSGLVYRPLSSIGLQWWQTGRGDEPGEHGKRFKKININTF